MNERDAATKPGRTKIPTEAVYRRGGRLWMSCQLECLARSPARSSSVFPLGVRIKATLG